MKAGGGKEEEVSGQRPIVETVARGEARGRKRLRDHMVPLLHDVSMTTSKQIRTCSCFGLDTAAHVTLKLVQLGRLSTHLCN
jgi:hypothetical protein